MRNAGEFEFVRQMITQAFVLGAGLGPRLRPLTDDLPKPLVPIFQKPLITFALDHLIAAGVKSFVINTHHLPGTFRPTCLPTTIIASFPLGCARAGPARNRRRDQKRATLLGNEPFIVYSGDVLTDLPLAPLIEEHFRSGNDVTLALRETGLAADVAFRDGRVVDIGNRYGAPRQFRLRQRLGLESADFRAHSSRQKNLVYPDLGRLDRTGRQDRRRRFG